ncbi:hypothetical protein HYT32_01685 [Candidatus Roizmanbacteria bacterium]|nr:hypothetical protein [Candidatus Roizmanbacteria bacterium]
MRVAHGLVVVPIKHAVSKYCKDQRPGGGEVGVGVGPPGVAVGIGVLVGVGVCVGVGVGVGVRVGVGVFVGGGG